MICFIHIAKTGGITLEQILINNYLHILLLSTKKTGNFDQDKTSKDIFLKEEARAMFTVMPFLEAFAGHSLRHYLGYQDVTRKPIQYITILRDPVARFISQFRQVKDLKKKMNTIEEFLEKRKNVYNVMTKRLAPNNDVEYAKDALLNHFTFVGSCEEYDRSLVLMKQILGIKDLCINYQRMNVNVHKTNVVDEILEDEKLLSRIRECNAKDIELYQFYKEKVFPGYVKNYVGNLDSDVAKLRESNANFSFSKFRQVYSTIYRHAVVDPLAYIVDRMYNKNSISPI